MYRITAPNTHSCSFKLPASKSISNRALLIGALAGYTRHVVGEAQCDDTRVMQEALSTNSRVIDVHNAGTAMRFLTAYFAGIEGDRIITGSPRMQQRPIGILVDALRQVGAQISYMANEGYPPLRIMGRKLRGGSITMRGDVSSQFISAMLMVAPMMTEGLQLNILGDILSQPYIDMTIDTMRLFGATVDCNKKTIKIVPQPYKKVRFVVESDWTAASYWYEISYLNSLPYKLRGLNDYFFSSRNYPKQGDYKVAQYYEELGIKTDYTDRGVAISVNAGHTPPEVVRLNLRNNPDLAQTIIIGCLLKGQRFCIEGLDNLRIKECDRIDALKRETRKLGYVLSQPHEGCLAWNGEQCEVQRPIIIGTHDDHRMAMAFAPAALVFDEIFIENPQVVEKSYPNYWNDLRHAGFKVESHTDTKEEKL